MIYPMQAPITVLIAQLRDGDRAVLDQVVPVVYGELHKIAAGYLSRERPSHTLQPTALVNEAYLRLLGAEHPDYRSRAHFFGVAASIMRQILVDHARERHAAKRGGHAVAVVINEATDAAAPSSAAVVAIDDALNALARLDQEKARIVELRFFGGMSAEEIAECLGDSVHRVRHQMRLALAWIHREVSC